MNSGQSMCGRNSVCTSADFRLSPETWKQRNKTQQRLPIISSYVQCSTTLMLPISLGMPIHCFTDFAWEPLNLCGYWWIGFPSQKMTHMGEQKYWNSGASNISPPSWNCLWWKTGILQTLQLAMSSSCHKNTKTPRGFCLEMLGLQSCIGELAITSCSVSVHFHLPISAL